MGKIQYCEGRSFEEVFKKFSPVISKLPGSCLSQSLRSRYLFGRSGKPSAEIRKQESNKLNTAGDDTHSLED